MKLMFLMVNDGSIKMMEAPVPTVKENFVIVETMYSVVSTGTERGLTSFGRKNLIQKCLERPDQGKKVTEKMSTDGILTTVESAFNKLAEPMPMGYSGVGKVVECGRGVTKIRAGDIVAMVGQAYHCEVNRVNQNLLVRVPESNNDVRQYAFAALGAIALAGIHQADVVSGETIAIIGMGLLGHIAARILNAYGCDVIGFDISDKSMPGTNLKAFVNSEDDNAADLVKSLTMGRGVDKVIITASTNSNAPMDLAAAIARDRGIICMVGVTQMNIDRRPYYEKELCFKLSRSYGPGRYDADYEEKGFDYPIGYVRFTEGRNVEEFVRLISEGRIQISDIITHVIDFDKAHDAYEIITTNKNREHYIGILLKYADYPGKWASRIDHVVTKATKDGIINVGLIGAGNFTRSTLLPIMSGTGMFYLRGIATTGGIGSSQAISSTPFDYSTNDYHELLQDESIDLVIITTNHNTHGKLVVEALKAGKHVYCEKALCMTEEELKQIQETYEQNKGELFCGLNRRYAPLIQDIRKHLNTTVIPAVYDYIVNAGMIPSSHWTQDEKVGGGRIIGEAIHFIDTIQYLDGSELTDVKVSYASNPAYPDKDNALITLRLASGAVGNVVYTSMGSKKYPKEELRVFSNGSVCEMDNYVKMYKYGSSKVLKLKLKQDKGFATEYMFIADVIKGKAKNKAILDAFKSHGLLIAAKKATEVSE
ncbi:MAG: Gfo/Idh/MocA family oxidoreductase [Clostridiales bacterium]|nr:Gfo/Idh/MocA family oxidoreductase [Clostridiales bacterium]